MWYVTLVDLWILMNPCNIGINPTWSWCMIISCVVGFSFLVFVDDFRVCVHQWYWLAIFFFCDIFVRVWNQDDSKWIKIPFSDGSLREWIWECSSSQVFWKRFRRIGVNFSLHVWLMGFPVSSAGKESACNAGYPGLIPGSGRSTGEGKGYPFQYSGLENSMDCIVRGAAKSQIQLSDFHITSLNVWSNSPVKPPGPGHLFVGRFLISVSMSRLVAGLFISSVSSRFSLGSLYLSKDLCISSRLSNLLSCSCL